METFRTAAAILQQQCGDAINTYIISMTTEGAQLLEVLLLAREARLFRPREGVSQLHIVPLFETPDALQWRGRCLDSFHFSRALTPSYNSGLECQRAVTPEQSGTPAMPTAERQAPLRATGRGLGRTRWQAVIRNHWGKSA